MNNRYRRYLILIVPVILGFMIFSRPGEPDLLISQITEKDSRNVRGLSPERMIALISKFKPEIPLSSVNIDLGKPDEVTKSSSKEDLGHTTWTGNSGFGDFDLSIWVDYEGKIVVSRLLMPKGHKFEDWGPTINGIMHSRPDDTGYAEGGEWAMWNMGGGNLLVMNSEKKRLQFQVMSRTWLDVTLRRNRWR